jgi:hypothetical protein
LIVVIVVSPAQFLFWCVAHQNALNKFELAICQKAKDEARLCKDTKRREREPCCQRPTITQFIKARNP